MLRVTPEADDRRVVAGAHLVGEGVLGGHRPGAELTGAGDVKLRSHHDRRRSYRGRDRRRRLGRSRSIQDLERSLHRQAPPFLRPDAESEGCRWPRHAGHFACDCPRREEFACSALSKKSRGYQWN